MNHETDTRYSAELETEIQGYLRQVSRVLRADQRPETETRGILADLETQIRSALSSGPPRPTIADLRAILDRMDPPQAFAQRVETLAQPCLVPGPRFHRIGWTVALGAALVVCAVAVYYAGIDAILFSHNQSQSGSSARAAWRQIPPRPAGAFNAVPLPVAATGPVAPEQSLPLSHETPAAANQAAPPTPPVSLAVAGFCVAGNFPDRDAVETAVADGVINRLSLIAGIRLVERSKLNHGLAELRMSAEGLTDQATLLRFGRIVGAQVIVAGSVVKLDDKLIITARLINAETSELSAVRVEEDRAHLLHAVDELADQIALRLRQDPKGRFGRTDKDAAAARVQAQMKTIKETLAGKRFPRILLMIPESHFGLPARDPAAETELALWMTDCGFLVASAEYEGIQPVRPASETTGTMDVLFRRNRGWRNEEQTITMNGQMIQQYSETGLGANRDKLLTVADVIILGEGISERASQREGIISCKARLEVKAVDVRTGRILLAASAYGAGVDVAERIAGKRALQAAAVDLAKDMLRSVVDKWNQATRP